MLKNRKALILENEEKFYTIYQIFILSNGYNTIFVETSYILLTVFFKRL